MSCFTSCALAASEAKSTKAGSTENNALNEIDPVSAGWSS
jgi:hypothetical protein